MSLLRLPKSLDYLQGSDRTMFTVFLIIVILTYPALIISSVFVLRLSLGETLESVTSTFVGTFSVMGIMSVYYNRKRGILRTRTVLKWFAYIGAIAGVISFPVAVISRYLGMWTETDLMIDDVGIPLPGLYVLAGLFVFIIFFAFFVILMLFFLIMGFGVMWLLVVVQKGTAPEFLSKIRKITPNTFDTVLKKDPEKYTKYRALGTFYNIPASLDSRTLTINKGKPLKVFPWKRFWIAMEWEVILGLVLAISITFNPALHANISVSLLISISGSLAFFVPLLILPWFIYMRLEAKIDGPIRPFRLFDGLRARTLQTFLAIGTLILLMRMAIMAFSPVFILQTFLTFAFNIVFISFVFTVVYFNYFENDLAQHIAQEYHRRTRKMVRKKR